MFFTANDYWGILGRKDPETEASELSQAWPMGPDGKRIGKQPDKFAQIASDLQGPRNSLYEWVKSTLTEDRETAMREAIDIADILHQKPGQTQNAIHAAKELLKDPSVLNALGGSDAAEKALKVVAFLNLADSQVPVNVIAGGEYSDDDFKKYIKPRHEHAANKYRELEGDPEIAELLQQARAFHSNDGQPSKIAQFAFAVHSICGVAAKPFAHEDKDITKPIVPATVINALEGNLRMKNRQTEATPGFVHEDLFDAIKTACMAPQFLDNAVQHKRENDLYSKDLDKISLSTEATITPSVNTDDWVKRMVEKEKAQHQAFLESWHAKRPTQEISEQSSSPASVKKQRDSDSTVGLSYLPDPLHPFTYKRSMGEKLEGLQQWITKKFKGCRHWLPSTLKRKEKETVAGLDKFPICSLNTFAKATKTGELKGRVFGKSAEGIVVGKNGARVRDVWLIPASQETIAKFKKGDLITIQQQGEDINTATFAISEGHALDKSKAPNSMDKAKIGKHK